MAIHTEPGNALYPSAQRASETCTRHACCICSLFARCTASYGDVGIVCVSGQQMRSQATRIETVMQRDDYVAAGYHLEKHVAVGLRARRSQFDVEWRHPSGRRDHVVAERYRRQISLERKHECDVSLKHARERVKLPAKRFDRIRIAESVLEYDVKEVVLSCSPCSLEVSARGTPTQRSRSQAAFRPTSRPYAPVFARGNRT